MTFVRFLPVALITLLAACNTVQGVGEDVSTAGRTIQSEAAETQSGM
jgi:predicted small secreted protein